MQKLIIIGISILFFFSVFFNVFQMLERGELKKQVENQKTQAVLSVSEGDTQREIQAAAQDFLQAFFSYDTSKETAFEQIKPYTTETARKILQPAGTEGNSNSKVKLVSKLDAVTIYASDKGKVLAKVQTSVRVAGGDTVTRGQYVELELVEKEKWLVNSVKVLNLTE